MPEPLDQKSLFFKTTASAVDYAKSGLTGYRPVVCTPWPTVPQAAAWPLVSWRSVFFAFFGIAATGVSEPRKFHPPV
jgi:hypothetical protein